jgi:8-oxo-dGTP pyrophosphatase MutT (NUDIX family)
VLVVLHVGGSKALDIKLVLQRKPRTSKTWFPSKSSLPNEKPLDAAVRELLEETGHTLTIGDFTLLSGKPVRAPLPTGNFQYFYVFSASIPAPYVTPNMRTHAKVEQPVSPQSANCHDGIYVVPATVDIAGLSLSLA